MNRYLVVLESDRFNINADDWEMTNEVVTFKKDNVVIGAVRSDKFLYLVELDEKQ